MPPMLISCDCASIMRPLRRLQCPSMKAGSRNCVKRAAMHSNTVAWVRVAPGIDAAAVIARAHKRYNLCLGAGLAKVVGKLVRIGPLGDLK